MKHSVSLVLLFAACVVALSLLTTLTGCSAGKLETPDDLKTPVDDPPVAAWETAAYTSGYVDLALTLPEGWDYSAGAREQAQIQIKYEGYLQKEMAQMKQARAMEEALIPPDADYAHMDALRLEARQKLSAQRPVSLGQASRIPGVSPADIAVLMVWLKRQKG